MFRFRSSRCELRGEPFESMKTYAEKLKDPRWQRKRLEVMERDGFACTICSTGEETLNVHHCYYGKGLNPWEYDDCHLITLCQGCHKDVETMREEILKEMTWEIPIVSIHAIATCGDPWMVSHVAAAFRGQGNNIALKSRAKMIRKGIERLDQIASMFESGKSEFDQLIESAPERP
jgi:5-methylcytosine-specific restriction endonuclease McrA